MKFKYLLGVLIGFVVMIAMLSIKSESNAATTYTENGVTATLADDGTLTVSGTGTIEKELIEKFNKDKIKSLVIEDGITVLGWCSFMDCKNLINVTIPSSVKNVYDYAFRNCSSLTIVTLPSSVNNVGDGPFMGCTNLTAINIDEDNSNFTSSNGILFNKDKTRIICYPAGKIETNYDIPEGVTIVDSHAFCGCKNLTNITIPDGVQYISLCAFSGCTGLRNIEIPNSVTYIERYAFEDCTSLRSIKIPNSVTGMGIGAFSDCGGLLELEISNNLENVEGPIFSYFSRLYIYIENETLEEMEIPEILERAITENDILYSSEISYTNCAINGDRTKLILDKDKIIKEGATIEIKQGILSNLKFYINYNYKDISKNEDGSVLAQLSEEGTKLTITGTGEMKARPNLDKFMLCKEIEKVIIEEGITNIGEETFSGCRRLTNVTIPEGVTSIGSGAFNRCSNLTSITIPEGVTSIEAYTFYECSSLTNITIPEEVTGIGNYAFLGCSSLTSITIPEGVRIIGYNVFARCHSLQEINVNENNNYYISENGILFNKNKTQIICYPPAKNENSYIIPNSVTIIGSEAFYGCSSLINIEIPSGVTSIGSNTFYNCSSLKSIIIPAETKTIGFYAFYGCSSLSRVVIPEGVTNIDTYAFAGCSNLVIYCKSNTVAQSYAEENNKAYVIDEEGPEIDGAPENWTKSNVTITIEDEKCGLKEATIGEEEIEIGEDEKATYTISAEGEWTIVAKDYLGNTSEKTIKIDQTAPTINVTGNLTEKTAEGVTLTVSATDNESGIPSQNAYSFDGGETWQTSNTKTYNENTAGIKIQVKDNAGNIGEYETINITNIKEISDIVEIKDYTLENNMVKYIQPNTTLLELENSVIIKDETKAKIVNKKGSELEETDIITTGSKIQIDAYNKQIEYIIVVAGDTTGDGKADMLDMISINKHRIKKKTLENEYFVAGDVNKDGKLDMMDMIIVNKYRIGKRNTL